MAEIFGQAAIVEALEKQAEKVGYKEVGLSAQNAEYSLSMKSLATRHMVMFTKDEYCPHIAMKKTLSGE